MKLRNLLLTAVAGLLAFCGCDLFENDKPPLLGITVVPDQVEIPQGGANPSIEIKTDQAWTITIQSDEDWLYVAPLSGSGSEYVALSAEANNGKDRSATIIVKAGYDVVSVPVTQLGSLPPGDGLTMETAFSASEARAWVIKELESGETTTDKYFVKGIIHKVQTTFEASGSYGNATFFISDNGQASENDFECFQVYYLGGRQWKSGDKEVAEGDEVIVYGPLTLYNSTPETAGKGAACLVKLNDETEAPAPPQPAGEPKGDGSLENPYNPAAAAAAAKDLKYTDKDNYDQTQPVYIKGKITSVETTFAASGSYGNASFTITDAEDGTGSFKVFQTYYLGNRQWKTGDTEVQVGDVVIVYGPIMNYQNNTPETVGKGNSYIYSLNGVTDGGTVEPPQPGEAKGDGTLENPYNPAGAAAVAKDLKYTDKNTYDQTQPVYIKGKITSVETTFAASGSYGNASFTIADAEDGTGSFKVFQTYYLGNRQWKTGDTEVQVGDVVIVYGPIMNYQNNTPETVGKGASYIYSLNGVTDGGTVEPPQPGEAKGDGTLENPYNPAGAAAVAKDLKYTDKNTYDQTQPVYIKGKITSVETTFAASGSYGNASFTITDAEDGTGSFKVFQTYYLGNRQWKTGDTEVQVGDVVIVYGPIMNYQNNTPETVGKGASYIYSLNGVTEAGGGGETPPADETLSVSEILALQNNVACDSKPSLVTAIATSGFVATDGTKSIYVYTQGTNFGGIAKIGDMVKFSGQKKEYSGMPEVATITSVEVVSSGNNVTYPNPKDITESAGTYTATEAEFVSLTGTLNVTTNNNKKYYNLALDAFADGSKMGSIVAPVTELNADGYNGKKITVTGYFNGLTSQNKYINIIATKIEEVEQPGEATLTNVTASFTETQLSASWNTVLGADYYQWMLYKLTNDGQLESESYLAYGLTTHTSITSTIGRNTSASDNKEEWSVSSLVNGKYAVVVIALSRQPGETQGTQIDMKSAGARYYYNLKVSGLECKDGVVSASWKAYTGENLAYYRWQLQLIKPDGTHVDVAMGNITGTSINETIGETWMQDDNNKTAWYVTALEAGDYYFGVLACSSENKILEQSEGTDHFTYSGSSQNESRTVEVVISEYATANNWTNGTKYTSIQKDDVTFTVSGGGNSGKYYTSGTNWRLYQSDTPSPTLTISAGNNYELVSVKIEYESGNTGVLTFDGTNLDSGRQVAFGAGISSATFGVGNKTDGTTNGQVRITKMTVVIK